jgi:hypothetical protein
MGRILAVCAVPLVVLAATMASAQGPPYPKGEPIPEAETRQLRTLLDIVRHADRVEALPVTATAGEGLSAKYDVVEKPVLVDAATGRSLGRLLTRYDWTGWSPSACMFDPAVAFRFHKGGRAAQVRICFVCGEMALDGIAGRFGQKKMIRSGRESWRRAAQKAFPNERFTELP